jgi:DNA (cytosine-5)-methyltransferase 1
MKAFYNENDPWAAAWLRGLSDAGSITKGTVCDETIEKLSGSDLHGFERVHFFAGIGGWDYALRLAGWPEGREVWTGSCPCQPFSAAGKQRAESDARHLWPDMRRLIGECRPGTLFGEQVASKLGREWLARVFDDLEVLGYRVAGADLCAASVGAPHIRQRLYWVADAKHEQRQGGIPEPRKELGENCERTTGEPSGCGSLGGVGDSDDTRSQGLGQPGRECREEERKSSNGYGASAGLGSPWSDAILLPCDDGKERRIEPSIEPLAHGIPRGVVPDCTRDVAYANATGEARKMRLRGYGNAIVPQVAAEFISAFLESED